ncbi:RICIN domain-containing protein [Paenibacillus oryzisoli]|uniref:Carbohydrate-binding protein n=1 Tax=Paenibacillus oryzisoli TaxID=1850517 RepID=A0A198A9S5_9BACL|nr:RICIN domain-containing protein [Paenibacillus oryzisoli]OAS17917.1 carbohydrate-binding protein [Paenibacillus oryzisoli]
MLLDIWSKQRKLSLQALLLVFAILIGFITVPAPTFAATQAQYYISPNGSDSNAGTLAAPFKTIQKARDVVRTINGSMTGDIIVNLRGGNYPVTSSIDFTSSDSGTNGNRIIYQAYPNETPILNAGVQVTGWSQHSGNIWKASLARSNKLRALYVDDKRAVMATKTVSSAGCYGTYSITSGQAPWAWETGSQCDGAKYSLSDFPAIASNQDDIEIETRTTWTTSIVGVRQVTVNGSNRVALFQQPGAAIAQGAFNGNFQINGSHKLMNAYEFLDTPGEFYFDKTSQTIYYYKNSSENMTTATVFAPNNVETILNLKGSSTSNHVRNITFSGITLLNSDWNLANVDGSSFKQAQQGNLVNTAYAKKNFHDYTYRNLDLMPGIVKIANADGIRMERNTIKHTGADGISLINDVKDSQLLGNFISDIGGSAINVGHPQHVYIGDYTSSNREKFTVSLESVCKNIDIKNNYIYDSAVLFNGSAAVSGYFTDTLNFQHNVIEKTPWAGISLGWGWWNFNGTSGSIRPGTPTTTAQNNSISYNQFIDTVQILDDTAPIYTLGSQPNTVISNNYIKGVPSGHKYGMHPDEGSAYITIQNNVLNINSGVTWTLNSDDFGSKHDLTFTQNYANVNKISNYNLPNSVINDVSTYSDNVWPVQAYNVAVNAGVEDGYKTLVTPSRVPLQDYVLPASVFVSGSTNIGIRSTGDASKSIWLAPSGTTSFTEGASMTKANGNATSIAAPQTGGNYKLFVIDAQGNRSLESASLVRVNTGSYVRIRNAATGLYMDGMSTTTNGADAAQWSASNSNAQQWTIETSGSYVLIKNRQTGLYLDGMARTGNGVNCGQWSYSGSSNQQWTMETSGSNVRFKNRQTGLYLDGMGRTSNGSIVGQWSDSTSSNQQWQIQ